MSILTPAQISLQTADSGCFDEKAASFRLILFIALLISLLLKK